MISARQRLIGQARDALAIEAPGLSWDRVVGGEDGTGLDKPELAPDVPRERGGGLRSNPLGKYKERVVLRFDGHVLEIESTEQAPPLGRITLSRRGEMVVDGPIDAAVWAKVGREINRSLSYGG